MGRLRHFTCMSVTTRTCKREKKYLSAKSYMVSVNFLYKTGDSVSGQSRFSSWEMLFYLQICHIGIRGLVYMRSHKDNFFIYQMGRYAEILIKWLWSIVKSWYNVYRVMTLKHLHNVAIVRHSERIVITLKTAYCSTCINCEYLFISFEYPPFSYIYVTSMTVKSVHNYLLLIFCFFV